MVPLYLLVVFNVVFNGYRLCGKLALFLFVWLRFFFFFGVTNTELFINLQDLNRRKTKKNGHTLLRRSTKA